MAQTAERVVNVATIAVVPFIAGIVARLLAPNYLTLPGRRLQISLTAIVATEAAAVTGRRR
ncbi:hypothetical protein [Micromonospora sp. NPDC050200]|uniref:hypothetical protein n=1 Tax=Micromonospora sp. NPDC050200 TaxID=3155664 RepID=UPI0033CFBB15